ncbi:hypothetical protein N7520_005492 [Penicillium odoratum]|uniref:uncharacterized protein n=1 Tax=Penicillium odoratum TaxID=1167516 RepID=UPI0025473980|nr:uncharacterized protein N7520_005492 [Penicillium odoratum]KAJ5765933.1 hypothetical protein N7520_005492 [Penicillium odoratum]
MSLHRFGAGSVDEMRSIQYFQARTLPALSGFFDTGVWDCLSSFIGQMEPTVLHAAIALGAYHEISENTGPLKCWDLRRNTSSNPDVRFASEQYARAISLFRRSLCSNRLYASGLEISCILFACVEFLRGDRKSGLAHISGALSFLELRQQTVLLSREEAALMSLIARLSLTQSLYGRPRSVQFPDLLDLRKNPLLSHDGKFCTLIDARMEITFLLNSTLRFVRMAVYDCYPDPFTALAAQRSLQVQLRNWSISFETFVEVSAPTTKDRRGACLLRIHHLMATIFVAASGAFGNKQESAYDRYLSNFDNILTLMEDITSEDMEDESSHSSSFSLDMGLIPPLFFTAIKCRFPAVRRRAIALLRCAPRQEGLWDAIESAKAAELAMKFEEQHIVDSMLSCEAPIPEWARVHDVDIHEKDPSQFSKQLVILRWKPDGIEKEMQDVRTYIQW